jgi:hypothetical protein
VVGIEVVFGCVGDGQIGDRPSLILAGPVPYLTFAERGLFALGRLYYV